ncbi:fumarylacetoacetate hydrolase family protein [Chitinasiproducens palmae]|uniref:2-keto-4-pentenoate hydratase/2-oxohepta-3-ene-1,7-dioic acid hydratase (Catechol pathway) n=1 Tax=Chitinasiproducens palmae TaxID=1770053 RepID=A0A1H2PU78_9BURK|nr:fumarylacetoacetate hydrolase family protein [Chitinasiproducens palmae]SDV50739.1 2-keto-4-pentenoate hydratase/2-oxohepta-3-ene-1,7-dioic acid hydratase (catechol pathway) [Chitinasiproducens palmae]
MKIARYQHEGVIRYGVVESERLQALAAPGKDDDVIRLLAALARGDAPEAAGWRRASASGDRGVSFDEVTWLPPIALPGKIIGVGRNYDDHASEMAVETPDVPKLFMKWPGAMIGHQGEIRHTAEVRQMDYEVEVAVVIGKTARHVPVEAATQYIAAFTILNDVSERALQMMPKANSTSFGKSLDTFCPIGPWLVTRDAMPALDDITLQCWVNGERLQHGHTSRMIFDIPTLIAYLSRFITLEAGDIIATGTPAGVGMFRKPPRWLQPGDAIRMEVSGIGTLENRVVAA